MATPTSTSTTAVTRTRISSSLVLAIRCTVCLLENRLEWAVYGPLESNLTEFAAYMSHFDKLVKLPSGFVVVASTANSEFAAIAHESKSIYGVSSNEHEQILRCSLDPFTLLD